MAIPLAYILSMADCVHNTNAELSECSGDHMAHKVKNIYYMVFYKGCANPKVKWVEWERQWQNSKNIMRCDFRRHIPNVHGEGIDEL